jgi:hypothetical protein
MNTRKLVQNATLLIGLLFMSAVSRAQVHETSISKLNFKDFTVNVKGNKINIDWSLDSTVETNYFEVQKSTDGKNFKTILLVLGADPKQTNCNCYGCYDKFVPRGSKHCYYRLVHVATDGTAQVSDARQLNESKQVVQN